MSFLYRLLPVLGSAVVKRLDSQLSAFDCLKAETREGDTFHFLVSFSAVKVIDGENIQPGHFLCQAHWTRHRYHFVLVRTKKKECLSLI